MAKHDSRTLAKATTDWRLARTVLVNPEGTSIEVSFAGLVARRGSYGMRRRGWIRAAYAAKC
jgi:hypothetical protein